MTEKIKQLKIKKNAIILAHYYAPAEVQQIADYVGDSFYLAKVAKSTDCDVIVFCGVSFMGESAKILNPNKKVLMPDITADCPMAHMASEESIKRMRALYPDLKVVCYINSTKELKALSDICVTSSNAVKIVKNLDSDNIYFIPDRNLGAFIKESVPEKNVILNEGFCPVHKNIDLDSLLEMKRMHPDALVLTHPECESHIIQHSDFIGSTLEIINFAKDSADSEFIICTEEGVSYKLICDNPDKRFYFPSPRPCCSDMKLNTLENVLKVLENESNEVLIDEAMRQRALIPLEKMLELSK